MKIAIIGAGLAGSTLGVLLAREGADVTLFDDGRRPELLVGESLVPALVPTLQRLGLEQEMAAFSQVKPGVSFIYSPTDRFSFRFARFAPAVFPYTYNTPRPRFDELLLAAAIKAGVQRVVTHAKLERAPEGAATEIVLAAETLAAAPWLENRQPDLIVDATGRPRLSARMLGIGARTGPRKDVSHFAHYENWKWNDPPGQLVIVRLDAGWAWCIPLQERLSIGIVVDREDMNRLGKTPAERLERAIATHWWMREIAGDAVRVTPIATYSNYQLVPERGHGPGWVMVGDAFGFVDPMLSPGVFLAIHSAELVANALTPFVTKKSPPSPATVAAALVPYAAEQTAQLTAWMELVEYFYDGTMAALFRAGRDFMKGPLPAVRTIANHHIERHIALQASGARTMSRYSRGLLRLLARHGLRGFQPADLAIR
jgi:flavin-dependent dehydrogenase